MSLSKTLGATLVTGGCGFTGYWIVAALLKEPGCGPIHVVSRNPTQNLHDGVQYHACDLRDARAVDEVVQKIRPRSIFHAASPLSSSLTVTVQEFMDTNVLGTKSLLAACESTGEVDAFVYTSSNGVMTGCPHIDADESTPYNSRLGETVICLGYEWSKTLAEQAVLAANNPEGMKTVAIRSCSHYGVRDNQQAPGLLPAVFNGQTKIQLGDNSNLLDVTWIGNAVEAHMLAGRALLNPHLANGRVDGEAFLVTDGNPFPFWDYVRVYWRAAGDKTDRKDVTVIPSWLAMRMAQGAEWLYWIGTFGTRKPASLNVKLVVHCIYNFTYDISKARRVLGYEPRSHVGEEIPKSVQYQLERWGKKPLS